MNADLKPAIDEVFAGYRAAILAKDDAAFAGLYAEDARIFDMWERWSYDGSAAWRSMATEWFGSLGEERVEASVEEFQVTARGELAVAHGYVTYAAIRPDGSRIRAMKNRLTWVLARRGSGWKIVHEHTSAPAEFATKKLL